jgi:hypothetical protein
MEDEARLEAPVYKRATLRRAAPIQPRVVVGFLLILAGLVWALARGLSSYGLGLADLGYDLDQPPLLLLLVGAWLMWRARRR